MDLPQFETSCCDEAFGLFYVLICNKFTGTDFNLGQFVYTSIKCDSFLLYLRPVFLPIQCGIPVARVLSIHTVAMVTIAHSSDPTFGGLNSVARVGDVVRFD